MHETPATILHLIGPDTAPQRLDVLREILDAEPAVGRQRVVAVGGPPPRRLVGADVQIAAPKLPPAVGWMRPPAGIVRERARLWHFWSYGALRLLPAVRSAHPDAAVVIDADAAAAAGPWRAWAEGDGRVRYVASGEVGGAVLERAGILRANIVVLALRAHAAPAPPHDRASIRRRLGLQEADQAVLVLPPVCRATAAVDAVWAAMIVQKVHEHVRVLLPGAGQEVSRILRLAEAAEQTFMIRATWDALRLDELLAAADLALFNAPGDAPADGLIRAMSAGVPIVARRSPVTPELLEDSKSAWLFAQGRPREIARRLVVALEEPRVGVRLARAAKKKAERLTDGSASVDRYAALVRELCPRA